MRADLNKQLCERPRSQSHKGFHAVRRLKGFSARGTDLEELPQRESIKKRYGGQSKEFGEHLNPLLGQVRKYLGKPWDRFYSDICQNFDMSKATNQHILQHLEDFCEKNIVLKQGELYVRSRYSQTDTPLAGSNVEFYVDPRDGLIKRNEKRRSYRQSLREIAANKAAERHRVFRMLDADNVLHLIEGIWYHFTLADIPHAQLTYVQPEGKNTFRASSGSGRMKCWEGLSQEERQAHGVRRWAGGSVMDAHTGQWVSRKPITDRQRRLHGVDPHDYLQGIKYHVRKKSASRKILARAGL